MIVDLLPNEDQVLVLDSLKGLLGDRLPVARLRDENAFSGAAEAAVWPRLAEMGLFGLGLGEACGGVGYGLPEEALVARELGRFLVSPDVLASLLAAHAAEDPLRSDIIGGGVAAALAAPAGGAWRLFDGAAAGLALTPSGLVDLDDLGRLEPRRNLDETVLLRRSAATAAEAPAADEALRRRGRLLMSAYLCGVAEAATVMAVEYAKVREQFGQPIGAFQAIKHICADMAMRSEAASAQTFYAALAVSADEDADAQVAAAALLAPQAALENARAAIQVHGGMGFTYECDAHFYLKRAHLLAAVLRAWDEGR